jgi:hypothetical protein
MGLLNSAAVGTAVGFIAKSEVGQDTLRKLAKTPTGKRLLQTRVGRDVVVFLSDGDGINPNRLGVTAGVAAGTVTQVLSMVKKLFVASPPPRT